MTYGELTQELLNRFCLPEAMARPIAEYAATRFQEVQGV